MSDELDGKWKGLFMALLLKVSGKDSMVLTYAELERVDKLFPGSKTVLVTEGLDRAVRFRLTELSKAQAILERDKQNKRVAS